VACPAPAAAPTAGEPRLTDPAAAVGAWGRAWASRHGATLDVVTFDPHGDPPADADVWVLPPASLPRWAAAGRLAQLPGGLTRRDGPFAFGDLLPLYGDHLLTWDQAAFAVPVLGEAPLCCYRADWLAEPAARAAFRRQYGHDPGPPATWEQFAQLAEFYRERRRGPSLPPLPADDRALDRLFYTVAAGYARRAVRADEPSQAGQLDDLFSFHYDLHTGKPRIDTPGFVYALELLSRLQKCRPRAAEEVPQRAFLRGQAVLCLADAGWVAACQRDAGLRDKVGVCRVPGGEFYFDFATGQKHPAEANRVPYLGGAGWLAAVPRGAAHAEAAFDLLADLAGPQASGQMVLDPLVGGGPVREEQLRRERWDGYDLDGPATLRLRDIFQETLQHRGIKNPALCLRTPWEAGHRQALHTHLREALAGKADAPSALRAAARRWEELDGKAGQAHLADYRTSLGLLQK
jgi:ABC-type glycerol-3-phosphate transport system substrate-binding protein